MSLKYTLIKLVTRVFYFIIMHGTNNLKVIYHTFCTLKNVILDVHTLEVYMSICSKLHGIPAKGPATGYQCWVDPMTP
jgi:hypothetical protein